MKALLVLYAGNLSGEAFETLADGKNSLILALERSKKFPSVEKTLILAETDEDLSCLPGGILVKKLPSWTVKTMLDTIAEYSRGFDFCYYAWADCPFPDPELAGKIADRHVRYAAEYSYADGWPYGLAPELISGETAAILSKLISDSDDGPVKRDSLFTVIQKDINAFDIETEISPVDLRCHRLSLCADSRRNLLLLRRFSADGIPLAADTEKIVVEKPKLLRTLPAFFPVQVFGGCPQSCAFCPWPVAVAKKSTGAVTDRRDYMDAKQFEILLDKIIAFSGDAVIDLSLWGEISLHPQRIELIEMVLHRPELSLVIETSGIGWENGDIDRCAELVQMTDVHTHGELPPLSWIVSLDAADPARYRELRGPGFTEASEFAKKLFTVFSKDVYVQAVRTSGAEADIERFYRFWKEIAPDTANVIIQKFDDFCGEFPRKQASDLSPVQRKPCWHLMRDMPVLIDGTVPLCREQISAPGGGLKLGNAFTETLNDIWERGMQFYTEQTGAQYNSLCKGCDEYYTYNF